MPILELLAPAKNYEYGKSAIDCGADAVYIGAPKFGARAAATNSIDEVEKLVGYAHKYRAKVYVALNTLLYNEELDDALAIIKQVWNAGTDALIIQDMGLLEMDLPPMPIFASTQTHNANWQKIDFLQNIGIQRVILARELSISQIQEIRKHTKVELESFVHGAICVCYSGQCYMSQALTGRSGNRGECAQPCRWDYSLKNTDNKTLISNKHLLSPKDLNLSNHLEALIDAGITSFKIEGRLKDLSYVKNSTSWYRQQLDRIIEKKLGAVSRSSSGKSIFNFEADPSRTFNRGFTDYFIEDRQTGMASFNTPKSLGTAIAEVLRIEKNRILVKNSIPINNGDGLCFFDKNNTLQGFRVNKAEGNVLFPAEMPVIAVGTKLYRNHDQKFESLLENADVKRKIDIEMLLSETDEGFSLQITDDDGNSVSENLITSKQLAQQPEKAMDNIKQNLSKCGQSIFQAKSIQLDLQTAYFIQVSEINELRRNTLQKLENERIIKYKNEPIPFVPNNFPYFEKSLDYRGNVLNHKARAFYERHGAKIAESGFELLSETSSKAIMNTRYCIKFEAGQCPKQNKTTNTDWNQPLFIESGQKRFKLEFDCKACEMKIYMV